MDAGANTRESSRSIASWEDVYKSKKTCVERISSPYAFPFYLAELARAAVPAPPPPRRRLMSEEEAPSSSSSTEEPRPNAPKSRWLDDMMIDEEGRGYVEVPLSYPPEAFGRGDDVARGRRLTQMSSYDPGTNTTTFVINGQTVIVNGNMAGSNMAWGLGLIDITQVNVRDAFTGMPLDESAKLRVYENGWVEVLRSTFYVGDRARFFYLAGANCDRFCLTNMCDGSLDIKYEIVFTNGFEYNNKHFSADQIGLMETTIVFFVLQMVLVLMYFVQRRELKAIHKHHHTVKLLGSSIILMMFAQGSYMLQYLWFASDGMGWLPLLFMAQILQGASETLFVLLLILIAKGWTICCRKISARGRVKIAVFGTVYAITWLAIPIYYHFFADKASTLTMYQSPWGYTLCALRIFGLGWFNYSASVTLKKYNSKVRFYKKFVSAFSFWFISQPMIVSIAFALVPWVRSVVITAMDLTVFFLFQAAMLSMYNPNTSFNKSFPFHATTNETFAHKGNVTRMVSQRRGPGGAMGGGGPNQSFGNTAFTSGGKGGAMNDFDRHELQAALHSARVLGQEAKKILACLEQLEASNEAESDDEAYEAENGGGGGFQDGNGGGFQGGNRPREPPTSSPRREYGDSYGGQGQGGAWNGGGQVQGGGRNDGGYGQGQGQGQGGAWHDGGQGHGGGDYGRQGPSSGGYGGQGSGSGPTSPQRDNGGFGAPRSNPIFSAAGGSPAATVSFQPRPPSNGLPPLQGGASAFGDVVGQRSLVARMASNHRKRQGSSGYT